MSINKISAQDANTRPSFKAGNHAISGGYDKARVNIKIRRHSFEQQIIKICKPNVKQRSKRSNAILLPIELQTSFRFANS